MSKMSELSLMLDELVEAGMRLTECGDALAKTAASIRDYFSGTDEGKPEPEDKEPQEAVQEAEPEKAYSKEDVRKLLSEKSVAGFREEAKALVRKYGGGSLTDVDPSKYPDLVKEAEALGNA